MSSHHSNRFHSLHHAQVNAARRRKLERQEARQRVYIERASAAKLDNLLVQVCAVFTFGYIMTAVPYFMNYIFEHNAF